MSIVFRMAREHCDKAWQRYDEQFLQAIAVTPKMSWGKQDMEICMTATNPTETMTPRGGGGHLAGHAQSDGGGLARTQMSALSGTKVNAECATAVGGMSVLFV